MITQIREYAKEKSIYETDWYFVELMSDTYIKTLIDIKSSDQRCPIDFEEAVEDIWQTKQYSKDRVADTIQFNNLMKKQIKYHEIHLKEFF